MCGIVGIVSNIGQYKSKLSNANKLLSHRGPDTSGTWWSKDNQVGFGHRRLSIIDLSPRANQPMALNKNQDLVIIFNGEIYNFKSIAKKLEQYGYKFKSSSDTEVILAAYNQWGEKCLDSLEGAFSFAIYDKKKNQIFIARDRTGEKPLYFSCSEKRFIFASEIKSLIEIDKNLKTINPSGLNEYLFKGYVGKNNCILKNINKLEAGNYLVYKLNEKKIIKKNYWNLNLSKKLYYNEKIISDNIFNLLKESVSKQLIADVPVGILLSGGVDSSLIAYLASDIKSKIKTYSIKYRDLDSYDESPFALKVAKFLGTNHIEIDASEVDIDLLFKLAKNFDEPISDPSIIPTFLICEAVSKEIKVVLGGDGGDELFGGYNHYKRLMFVNKFAKILPLRIRKYLISNLLKFLPIGTKGYNWLEAFKYDVINEIPFVGAKFNPQNQISLFKDKFDYLRPIEKFRNFSVLDRRDYLDSCLRHDFENFLTDNILVKVDRSSMINSLEVRSPFLSYKLIEFAFTSIPSSFKSNIFNNKIILKKLLKNIFPEDFDFSRKQGLNAPLEKWLQDKKWFNFFSEVLTDDSCLFNRKLMIKMLNDKKRYRHNSEKLFNLVIFELWRKNYDIKV